MMWLVPAQHRHLIVHLVPCGRTYALDVTRRLGGARRRLARLEGVHGAHGDEGYLDGVGDVASLLRGRPRGAFVMVLGDSNAPAWCGGSGDSPRVVSLVEAMRAVGMRRYLPCASATPPGDHWSAACLASAYSRVAAAALATRPSLLDYSSGGCVTLDTHLDWATAPVDHASSVVRCACDAPQRPPPRVSSLVSACHRFLRATADRRRARHRRAARIPWGTRECWRRAGHAADDAARSSLRSQGRALLIAACRTRRQARARQRFSPGESLAPKRALHAIAGLAGVGRGSDPYVAPRGTPPPRTRCQRVLGDQKARPMCGSRRRIRCRRSAASGGPT